MTQPSRTTETINRDNEAIRNIMHQARELTVPDRATLTLGLVGHLATMMNRSQMTKLMGQLQEEVTRVQDVPPSRQREEPSDDADVTGNDTPRRGSTAHAADGRSAPDREATIGHVAAAAESGGRHRSSENRDERAPAGRATPASRGSVKKHGDVLEGKVPGAADSHEDAAGSGEGVGQAGRGEFRSRKLM